VANLNKKRFEFQYECPQRQMEALLGLAHRKDQPIESLILEAIDQFIEREAESCRSKK
jgi:hypothetical protein